MRGSEACFRPRGGKLVLFAFVETLHVLHGRRQGLLASFLKRKLQKPMREGVFKFPAFLRPTMMLKAEEETLTESLAQNEAENSPQTWLFLSLYFGPSYHTCVCAFACV